MLKDKLVVISDNPAYERWAIENDEEDQLFVMGKVLIRQSIDLRRFG